MTLSYQQYKRRRTTSRPSLIHSHFFQDRIDPNRSLLAIMANLWILRNLQEQESEDSSTTQAVGESLQLSELVGFEEHEQGEEGVFQRQVRPRLEPLEVWPHYKNLDSNA